MYLILTKEHGNVPIKYVIQIMEQMIVWDCDYMEFAVLKDGNSFEILPFEVNADTEGLRERIINETMAWWYDKVIPAKEAQHKIDDLLSKGATVDECNELSGILQHLEPLPDDTKAYENFYKSQYRTQGEARLGTDEEYVIALDYNNCLREEKTTAQRKQEAKNKILHFMKDVEIVDFGEYGKITWRREEGKREYFSVKIVGE